jgi:putative aminopeptidase FrvX
VYEKAKEAGVAVRLEVVGGGGGGGAAATVNVTGTVSGVLAAPVELMLTLPL